MMKPKVLITNRFNHGVYLQASTNSEAEFIYDKKLQNLSEHFADCCGLIVRSSTKVDRDLLAQMPQLQFVITATSGFDHFDLRILQEKKIQAFHVPETQSVAAAELSILLMLACCRKFPLASSQVQKGEWQRERLLGRQLTGMTLGIVGLGRVGNEVANRALGLGLKVQAFDPYIEDHRDDVTMLGYEELMRSSDIVSLHVPKTKRTRHMIKKETLEWLGPESILINMSRGDVVREEDLVRHLIENKGFTAGLDVFEREPLVKDSPLQELLNVVMTPHVGASTEKALKESSQRAIDMAQTLLKGNELSTGHLPPRAHWWGE